MGDTAMKTEDGAERKAGYKSWKKKYRKMRIVFENKMQESEQIFEKETKATATAKRLAIENDRLLDMLMEINNSPQIPTERRIDVALPPSSDPKQPTLAIDRDHPQRKDENIKKLESLIEEVPHLNYSATKDAHPSSIADIEVPEGEITRPVSFLTADDVDNYLHLLDTRLEPDKHRPTLAPLAHPNTHPPVHPLLRNPTSSISWLRKHAPHIFLLGHCEPPDSAHPGDGDDAASSTGAAASSEKRSAAADDAHGSGSARKARGGRERGGRGSRGGKRASTGASRARTPAVADRSGDWDVSMDDEGDARSTPVAKGKRKRDDDPGYRPKGSGSRPSKKKRKSEGEERAPTSRKSKKDRESAAADTTM